jgi:hypothetical protein
VELKKKLMKQILLKVVVMKREGGWELATVQTVIDRHNQKPSSNSSQIPDTLIFRYPLPLRGCVQSAVF